MTTSALNLVITHKADADEQLIYDYIKQKFGKGYAEKFRADVIQLFQKLLTTPFAGRAAANDKSIRVFVLNRQTKVVYLPTDKEIIILRILNTRSKKSERF